MLYGHITPSTDLTNVTAPSQWIDRLISISYPLWEHKPRCTIYKWGPETNTLEVQVVFPSLLVPLTDTVDEFMNRVSVRFVMGSPHDGIQWPLFSIYAPRRTRRDTRRVQPLTFTLRAYTVPINPNSKEFDEQE